MNRCLLAGLCGLALAGCANGRSSGTPVGQPLPPVGFAPISSLHQSINPDEKTAARHMTSQSLENSLATIRVQAPPPLAKWPTAPMTASANPSPEPTPASMPAVAVAALTPRPEALPPLPADESDPATHPASLNQQAEKEPVAEPPTPTAEPPLPAQPDAGGREAESAMPASASEGAGAGAGAAGPAPTLTDPSQEPEAPAAAPPVAIESQPATEPKSKSAAESEPKAEPIAEPELPVDSSVANPAATAVEPKPEVGVPNRPEDEAPVVSKLEAAPELPAAPAVPDTLGDPMPPEPIPHPMLISPLGGTPRTEPTRTSDESDIPPPTELPAEIRDATPATTPPEPPSSPKQQDNDSGEKVSSQERERTSHDPKLTRASAELTEAPEPLPLPIPVNQYDAPTPRATTAPPGTLPLQRPNGTPQNRARSSDSSPQAARTVPTPPGRPLIDDVVPARNRSDSAALAIKSKAPSLRGQLASQTAARVGNSVITLRELNSGVQEWMEKNAPPGSQLNNEEINRIASIVLDDLIERSIILQEAHRKFKNPKQWDKLHEFADKDWREKELPPVLKRMNAVNEYELRAKLGKEGKSLDEMHDRFREMWVAREFLRGEVGPRLQVDLPAMLSYYKTHIKDYHQPEEVTWREIMVSVSKYNTRVEAKAAADALLEQLRRGADFAQLARSSSHGATAAQGGLWTTSPGGYGVPAVNSVLTNTPAGWISRVIEAPDGFHIVRVDSRRAAGPKPFAEVQERIRDTIFNENIQREASEFIKKLKSQTQVTSIFDGTPSAPRAASETP